MIAGAEYLRSKEDIYIVSRSFGKQLLKFLPLEGGLPLAIKLETLINVLSINTNGVEQ